MSETNLHNRKKPSKPLTGKDAVKKVNDVQNDDGITWQLNSNHVAQLQQRQQEIGRKVFRRAIKRVLLLAVALLVVYMYRKWTQDTVHTFASSREPILQAPIALEVACSVSDYDRDRQQFPRCCPFKCGRVVSDAVISEQEASGLLAMAKRTFDLTKSNGSASILDLHSGALSDGVRFVNLYHLMKQRDAPVLNDDDFELYRSVKNKLHSFVSRTFGVAGQYLYLTKPTFFSKLTANNASNVHDQYWHPHIDKHTYPAFHYTSLLYLNTYYKHFSGGRFMFVDDARNSSIEPRVGRVSAFTSGAENRHFVEPVVKGVRYAITISFTCDPHFAIQDPNFA